MPTPFTSRIASAPISWGICEVPGWGAMLPTDRVLAEMSGLGLPATELGAPGFLPDDEGDRAQRAQRKEKPFADAAEPEIEPRRRHEQQEHRL